MKRVINDLVFDTDKAEEISESDNGYYAGDFKYYCETLYRTKKGNWFIKKRGGAMSCMQTRCGSNNYCGSSVLQSLSSEEVEEWMKVNDKVDLLIKYFPESITEA